MENQSMDLLCKSMNCFLHDRSLRQESVKGYRCTAVSAERPTDSAQLPTAGKCLPFYSNVGLKITRSIVISKMKRKKSLNFYF